MVDNTRLIYAVILSVLIMLGFHFFYERPRIEQFRAQQAVQESVKFEQTQKQEKAQLELRDRAAVLADDPRVQINTPSLRGSVNLRGGRIDDLTLPQYRETADPGSPPIVLLSPPGSAAPHRAYYAAFGWLADAPGTALPDNDTLWRATGKELTQDKPLTLTWDNGQGITFTRTIAVDENAMFTMTDGARSTGAGAVTLHPYGLVLRHGVPEGEDAISIAHTGPTGVFDGTLHEHSYDKLVDEKTIATPGTGGWLGITDKYWLVALVPGADEQIVAQFKYSGEENEEPKHGRYQTDFRGPAQKLAPGGSVEHVTHLFAGPKLVNLLDSYGETLSITRFDRAIDFGWFYFLTKPLLKLLDWLAGIIGNTGLAIIALTVLVKLCVLPLGVKSYTSMARMKKLQPEMKKLTERYKDDRTRQSVEMMELYKREKVSPFSGCVPILFQIPVFFALYKVLYVGIEMRHAPFFGWIRDLSAPDPTTIVNLFGLLPYDAPGFLGFMHIGVWPLLMGISMFLQQKMSPQPADPVQAKVFILLPIVFTFMLGPTMASGLIVYWTCSNLISIAQQFFIYRRLGIKLS
ncbi:MAG: membrane protein insertase YidC [Alphaproteobacteria bacterium]|nr:membrane protein insertase YidC [Alphaproteobacteria bacterium]